MFLLNLGRIFGRTPPPVTAVLPAAMEHVPKRRPVKRRKHAVVSADPWTEQRINVANRLWGTGFSLPGGEAETLRLTRPTGASGDNRLLLVGMGAGGMAMAIERNMHTWLTALESDPVLLTAGRALAAAEKLGKRVTIDGWDALQPKFPAGGHKNCLAIEPMRQAGCATILPALISAIGPGGNLIVVDVASMDPIPPGDPLFTRWAALEHRKLATVPTPQAVTAVLEAHRMDLRIAEDISPRHIEQVMHGWRDLVVAMAENKPPADEAAYVVSEAELWLLRRRLIESGRMRLMRWHAIKPG